MSDDLKRLYQAAGKLKYYMLDLTKALSEVASAYEASRQADATLPSFDQLLHDPS